MNRIFNIQSKTFAMLVVATALVIGPSSDLSGQSNARETGSANKMAKKEQMSRAFTNGYNVPSSGVAIDGYCPVCYISANKAVKGSSAITHDFNGVTYWFVSDEARKMFAASPEKYLPAYGGWCGTGVSMGQRFPVDPTNFKIVNGKIVLFLKNAKVDAKEIWSKDESEMLSKANANWAKLKG